MVKHHALSFLPTLEDYLSNLRARQPSLCSLDFKNASEALLTLVKHSLVIEITCDKFRPYRKNIDLIAWTTKTDQPSLLRYAMKCVFHTQRQMNTQRQVGREMKTQCCLHTLTVGFSECSGDPECVSPNSNILHLKGAVWRELLLFVGDGVMIHLITNTVVIEPIPVGVCVFYICVCVCFMCHIDTMCVLCVT
eukprot:GHVR01166625.1.p1 GENE.GHVR01166625.1~~GHVR01166625.1.p1  ORF type:complete len:193 (-),score=40.04 GHVR01166625.1:707-1285(-)